MLAGGHAAFNPEPIARFIDAAVLGDGEQAVLEMTEVIRQAKKDGASREELLLRLARTGGVYVPAFYDVSYLPDGRIAARRAEPLRRAVPRAQAHRHGPRRVAVPEDAARAAGRDRPRADERRDLPRLHPRLPLLPGRHDHPAGARAQHHRHRRDGAAGPRRDRLRGGRAAQPVAAPTTPRSPRSPRASPTGTRAPRPASACPAPASTRSTSTSPRSSAATAGAPA